MDYLNEYYSNCDEDGRLLSRHGQVEYLTTMKYIRACLSEFQEPEILEIGAGTGRYSVTLAKQGFRVTAVELVSRNLEQLKAKLDGSEPITAVQGNALWNLFHVNDPKDHEWHYRGLADSLKELSDTFAYQEFVRLSDDVFKK